MELHHIWRLAAWSSPALLILTLHAAGVIRLRHCTGCLIGYILLAWGLLFFMSLRDIEVRTQSAYADYTRARALHEAALTADDSTAAAVHAEAMRVASGEGVNDTGGGIVLLLGWLPPLLVVGALTPIFVLLNLLKRRVPVRPIGIGSPVKGPLPHN
ncbi:MAG: hypothetical protein QGI24_06665 [Kiritimatiellia bacterium]|jgi:hypothetical protein|nr:hypothetical protein [Kiritimatiellia bacterium]